MHTRIAVLPPRACCYRRGGGGEKQERGEGGGCGCGYVNEAGYRCVSKRTNDDFANQPVSVGESSTVVLQRAAGSGSCSVLCCPIPTIAWLPDQAILLSRSVQTGKQAGRQKDI